MRKQFLLLFFFVLILTACSQNNNDAKKNELTKKNVTITISAAASLHDVLTDIRAEFNKKYPNIEITYNFGGSGTLQQQIINGAPIDLFLLADEEKADQLAQKGLIKKESAKNLLGNKLVLITPKGLKSAPKNLDELLHNDIKKIAIGTPEIVPAGKYTKQSLEHYGLWSKLENKLILTKDVRQVLTYVENGNVDAGFVYVTDATQSNKVNISVEVPPTSHTPIVYSLGILNSSKQLKETSIFYDFLISEIAEELFQKHRFIVLE
jgi:molybdate transport system substrate-binding protein